MVRGSCLFRNGTVRVAVVQRNKIKREEVRVIYIKEISLFFFCVVLVGGDVRYVTI